MSLTRRSFLATAGAGALAAGCSTGGSASSGSTAVHGPIAGKISLLTPIFSGATGKKVLEGTVLPAFYQKYPKVKVSVDYTTYDALNEKLTTGLASGLLADVVMLGVGWVPPFAHKDVLAPLPESLAARYHYQNRVLDPSRYQGKLYALPVVLDTRLVAYRKDFFEQAGIKATPTNWTELRAAAKELTQRSGGRLTRAGFDPFSVDLRQCWEDFLFANGGTMFSGDGRTVKFNDDHGIAALQLFLDVIKDKSADFSFTSETGQASTIQQGRSAMMVANNSLWVSIQQQSPQLVDKIDCFLMQNTRPAMMQGGTLVAQSAHSNHSAAARALVEFLGTPEVILPESTERGAVPSLQNTQNSAYVKNNKFVRFALSNLDNAYSEGGTPAWMEIRDDFAPALQAAIVGKKSAKQAMSDITEQANQAISRI